MNVVVMRMSKKNYILDTNVLMTSPSCIEELGSNNIIIPLVTIEELDNNKQGTDIRNINARKITRKLDSYRIKGNLVKGVKTEAGGIIKVAYKTDFGGFPEFLDIKKPDNIILAVANNIKHSYGKNVFLISNDINVRIKASSLDINVEPYEADNVINTNDGIYQGTRDLLVDEEIINLFYEKGKVKIQSENFYPNEFITLISNSNEKHQALTRYCNKNKELVKLEYDNRIAFGIKAKNKEQKYLFEALFNPNIKLVTVNALSGCGKTLCSIAYSLEETINNSTYSKAYIGKMMVDIGKDMGALPGDLSEKSYHHLMNYYDNIEFILSLKEEKEKNRITVDYLMELANMEIQALNFIRGRSISGVMIFDEMQNSTRKEIKALITRMNDENSKLILLSDLNQIDAKFINEQNSGMTHVIEKFKDQEVSAHITLRKTERGKLADLAAKLL